MPVERFAVTPVITGGAYSANDVIGGLLTFKGLRGGTLQSVTITDKAAQSVDYLLVLFDDTPTGISDNATFDITDADLPKIIRRIDLTAASNRQAFTDNAIYSIDSLDIPVRAQCPAVSAFLITLGTPTYASTSDITVVLQVDTDYVSGRNQGTTNPTAVSAGDNAGGALNGTYPSPNLASDAVDTITEIAAALKTGVDGKVVTGTAGTNGDLSQWNVDGDLVDGPTPPSGTIVGTSDTQTLTNKTLTTPTISSTGFTNAQHAHAAANSGGTIAGQKIFIPAEAGNGLVSGTPATQNNRDDYPAVEYPDGSTTTWAFAGFVPFTPTAIKLVVVTAGTGDIRMSFFSDFGASGELSNANSDSLAEASYAATINQILEIDIIAAFTGIAAGDYFGINTFRVGGSGSDTIGAVVYGIGLLIEA